MDPIEPKAELYESSEIERGCDGTGISRVSGCGMAGCISRRVVGTYVIVHVGLGRIAGRSEKVSLAST